VVGRRRGCSNRELLVTFSQARRRLRHSGRLRYRCTLLRRRLRNIGIRLLMCRHAIHVAARRCGARRSARGGRQISLRTVIAFDVCQRRLRNLRGRALREILRLLRFLLSLRLLLSRRDARPQALKAWSSDWRSTVLTDAGGCVRARARIQRRAGALVQAGRLGALWFDVGRIDHIVLGARIDWGLPLRLALHLERYR